MAKRVLFSGSIAGHASGYGGNTWAFLQWVLGFRRLGFEVYYVEEFRAKQDLDDQPKPPPLIESASGRYMQTVIERFDLGDHAALLEAGSSAHVGLSRHDISRIAPDIDLFLNQFGSYTAVLPDVRRSIYLDLDPGQTQIWQEQYGLDMNLRGHDLYLTVGLNLGEPDCPLPTCGIRWEKTLFPIVLSEWETEEVPGSAFTTVANWRDYSWLEWQGTWFAQKAEAFKAVIDLPRRVSVPIEVCLSILDSDPELPLLRDNGWRLELPRERVGDADSYRRYIQQSRGELALFGPSTRWGEVVGLAIAAAVTSPPDGRWDGRYRSRSARPRGTGSADLHGRRYCGAVSGSRRAGTTQDTRPPHGSLLASISTPTGCSTASWAWWASDAMNLADAWSAWRHHPES